jgi:DNA-binding NtrC family response regulator
MRTAAVLLVDDDPALLEPLAVFLRGSSLRVQTATSVDGALALLRTQPFDVLVTDYDLSDNDTGGDLLEIAAAKYPAVGRVLHSGSPVPRGLQAHAFVEKPSNETLVKVIRALARICR